MNVACSLILGCKGFAIPRHRSTAMDVEVKTLTDKVTDIIGQISLQYNKFLLNG